MFPQGVTPDILLLPSQLKLFAKEIGGVVCVNPGYINLGEVRGSYASITIDAPAPTNYTDGNVVNREASKRIRVDIINT